MSLLWAIPGIVVVAGLAAMGVLLRDVDDAAAELRDELGRLDELRDAIHGLRSESADTRAAVSSVRRQG